MAIGIGGDSMEDGADIIQVTLSSSSTVDMWTVQSHGDGFSHVVNVNSARSEHWVGSQQAQVQTSSNGLLVRGSTMSSAFMTLEMGTTLFW